MKKLLLPLLFLLFAISAQAQPASNAARYVQRGLDAAKGATCSAGKIWLATDTGILYLCPVSTWVSFGTGGGSGLTIGTTTVTSGTGTRLLYETSGNKVGEISGATSDGTTLTLVAPILGTPASVTLTNATGTAASLIAGKATILNTARTIGGTSFDGSANITVATATGGFTISGGDLALGANNLTMTGSLGATGARLTKGWFTDLQVTNAIAGSVTGNAATVTTNANLTGPITSVGNATSIASQTGTGTTLVVDTAPTIGNPVIANIAPNADFTITQNSVAPFKSVNTGAIVDTLRLDAGIVLVGTTASKTSATSGDEVLPNNHFLRGTTSAGTNTRGLIGFNSSNIVSIDTTGTGTVFGGTITSSSGSSTLGSSSQSWGALFLGKIVTAGGTTGAQTINQPTGSVNFAAAATSLVVTNSLVATTSVIQCTVGTNDTTMKSVQCVAGTGSFTIFSNAAATAETRVNFTITN